MPRGKPEPAEVRFWRFVDKRAECWVWTGTRNQAGYGMFTVGGERRTALAHRTSYTFTYGPIPEGMFVCHKCDNPSCVRPDHLFVGTRADNMRDAHQKGRIDLSYVGSAPRPGRRKPTD